MDNCFGGRIIFDFMNKRYSLFGLAALTLVGLTLMGYNSGSPGGRTGSPTDASTCGVAGCHGTQTPAPVDMISSDIPSGGYVPGASYEISVSPTKEGISKFGFEMVAEDDNGTKVGTFTDNTEVTAWINDQRVTHKSTSTSATDGTRTWTVSWEAPSAGTGQVTFYAACLAANGNGNNAGDSVLVDSYSVQEQSTASLAETSALDFKAYPNPFVDHIIIKGVEPGSRYTLHSLQGEKVMDGKYVRPIQVSQLANGHYILRVHSGSNVRTATMIKK